MRIYADPDPQHCFQVSIVDSFGILALLQVLIAEKYGILALFQALITDSFGILALFQLLIAESFGILPLFQALIAGNFGIFNTLGKNKYHSRLKPMTSTITFRYSTNCTANSLRLLYIKRDTKRNTGDVRQETYDRRREAGDLRQEK